MVIELTKEYTVEDLRVNRANLKFVIQMWAAMLESNGDNKCSTLLEDYGQHQ